MKAGVTTTWLEVNDVNGILPMVQHCFSLGLVDFSVVLSLSYVEFVYNYDFDMIWIGCQSMFMKEEIGRGFKRGAAAADQSLRVDLRLLLVQSLQSLQSLQCPQYLRFI